MNPLYALKRWHYQRTVTPYVASLASRHRAALKRVSRRQASEERRAQLHAVAARIKRWITTRGAAFASLAGIYAAAVAATVFVCAQPVIDAQQAELATAKRDRDEWRAIATRQATNEITVNLRGNASEVRKSVKRIAEDI